VLIYLFFTLSLQHHKHRQPKNDAFDTTHVSGISHVLLSAVAHTTVACHSGQWLLLRCALTRSAIITRRRNEKTQRMNDRRVGYDGIGFPVKYNNDLLYKSFLELHASQNKSKYSRLNVYDNLYHVDYISML